MNFEEIKKQMDTENNNRDAITSAIKQSKNTNMPIAKVRRRMKSEIITQLAIIIVFFGAPNMIQMHQFPKAVYYILMFVTCLITLGYLLKMGWFLKRTSNMAQQSKYVVLSFIHDLKLTLEVYKTAIIAGSLLLPLAMVALYFGIPSSNQEQFMNIISLNIPLSSLLLYVLIYLIMVSIIYFGTVSWAHQLYGVHIKELEKILKAFDVT